MCQKEINIDSNGNIDINIYGLYSGNLEIFAPEEMWENIATYAQK